jgi:hypothetical protein
MDFIQHAIAVPGSIGVHTGVLWTHDDDRVKS